MAGQVRELGNFSFLASGPSSGAPLGRGCFFALRTSWHRSPSQQYGRRCRPNAANWAGSRHVSRRFVPDGGQRAITPRSRYSSVRFNTKLAKSAKITKESYCASRIVGRLGQCRVFLLGELCVPSRTLRRNPGGGLRRLSSSISRSRSTETGHRLKAGSGEGNLVGAVCAAGRTQGTARLMAALAGPHGKAGAWLHVSHPRSRPAPPGHQIRRPLRRFAPSGQD